LQTNLLCKKGKIFSKIFENCAFYGQDTKPEPEPERYPSRIYDQIDNHRKLTQFFGQHVELFHIVEFIQLRVLLPWILGRLGTGITFFYL
jgi:hypothetical protein